ncbi:MAG: hypothetical protein ACHREM_03400 [Polyangiales bacterium]
MPRPKTPPPAVTLTFQSLIRDTMRGLEKEFSALVEAKLTDLIGRELAPSVGSSDASSSSKRSATGTGLRSAKTRPPAKARGKSAPTKRRRVRTSATARTTTPDLVSAVIEALSSGASLGKSALLKAAGLSTDDAERVHGALKQLRAAGTVVMTGSKRGTAYRLA